jgi:pyruvate,orthophosphate dikinase
MEIVRIADKATHLHSAEEIGAKAANLERMASLAIPVPPGFVLPVSLCGAMVAGDPKAKDMLEDGLAEGIAFLEDATSTRFGDRRHPLLVSVRSGAARSMPGMLDTVLNVGCTPAAVRGLVRSTGNPRFAWDCRRRFLESYGNVVLGIDAALFAGRLAELLAAEGASREDQLDGEALERLSDTYRELVTAAGEAIQDDPVAQLKDAAQAVYRSWTSDRACTYRRLEHLEHLQGTAVTIQAMVFGNRGLSSGAGVAFSRDPSTGAGQPMIEVMFEAQGEDVVSGRRTPENEDAIARLFPAVARELRATLARLEREFSDVQDVEFTIEQGKLWILQARSAKRTPLAALRFAIDFVRESMISPAEALKRLHDVDLDALTRKRLVDAHDTLDQGIGASAGVAAGRAAFDSKSAERLAADGNPVVLIRPDTSTADVAGFATSVGIVTAVGGRTSHAALVARQMGKPCVVGCPNLNVDAESGKARFGDMEVREGDWISIDGEAGTIYLGQYDVAFDRPQAELAELERWRAEAAVNGCGHAEPPAATANPAGMELRRGSQARTSL